MSTVDKVNLGWMLFGLVSFGFAMGSWLNFRKATLQFRELQALMNVAQQLIEELTEELNRLKDERKTPEP